MGSRDGGAGEAVPYSAVGQKEAMPAVGHSAAALHLHHCNSQQHANSTSLAVGCCTSAVLLHSVPSRHSVGGAAAAVAEEFGCCGGGGVVGKPLLCAVASHTQIRSSRACLTKSAISPRPLPDPSGPPGACKSRQSNG